MKNRTSLLFAAFLLALPLACKSTASEVPCCCGTPMADLEGCAHADCMSGSGNSANPSCVCGTIEIPAGKKN